MACVYLALVATSNIITITGASSPWVDVYPDSFRVPESSWKSHEVYENVATETGCAVLAERRKDTMTYRFVTAPLSQHHLQSSRLCNRYFHTYDKETKKCELGTANKWLPAETPVSSSTRLVRTDKLGILFNYQVPDI